MPDLEKTISGLWEIVAWAEAKPYITTAAQMESALSAAKDAIALLEKQRKKKCRTPYFSYWMRKKISFLERSISVIT